MSTQEHLKLLDIFKNYLAFHHLSSIYYNEQSNAHTKHTKFIIWKMPSMCNQPDPGPWSLVPAHHWPGPEWPEGPGPAGFLTLLCAETYTCFVLSPGLHSELYPQTLLFYLYYLRQGLARMVTLPGWTWTHNPPILASRSAGIIGLRHPTWQELTFKLFIHVNFPKIVYFITHVNFVQEWRTYFRDCLLVFNSTFF